jgi:hypothetical protein
VALGGTVLASNLAKRKKSKDTNNSEEDNYNYAKTLAGSGVGRASIGAGLGALAAQGVTSFGTKAEMRRQLKAKLKDKTISTNERAQLRDLLNERTKTKWTAAKLGAVAGYLAPQPGFKERVKYHPYVDVE